MRTLAKIFILLLATSLFLPVFSAQAQGSAVMILTSARTDYYLGETVYVDIQVKTNGEELNVARAIMDFTGNDVLIVQDFDPGSALPYISPGKELNNDTNHINVGTFLLIDSVSEDFLMGTLIFKANQLGSSDIGKPFLTGSHLISPQQEEKINLAGCQGITINVIESPAPNNAPIVMSQSIPATAGYPVSTVASAFDFDGDIVTITWDAINNDYFSNPVSGVDANVTFTWTPTKNGVYTFRFYATDNHPTDPKTTIGIIQVTVTGEIYLPQPNLAPIFQPVANKSIAVGGFVGFQVVATDPDNNNINLTWDIPSGALMRNLVESQTATADFAWTPSSPGSYTLHFFAVDDHPTDPKSATLTVIINVSVPIPPTEVNHPPVFQPISNKSINLGESVNFPVSATDPDGDMVILDWNIPAGASFSNVTSNITATGDFSWTPTQEGVYNVIFFATDDNPTDPKSSTLTVSIGVSVVPPPPNHSPIFENIGEKVVNAGETVEFDVMATDPDGDNVIITMDPMETAAFNLLSSGATATGHFSWQPQNYGIYYVLFRAVDDYPQNPLSDNMSVRITVFGGQCPPCSGGPCPALTCEEVEDYLNEENVLTDKAAPIIISPTHPDQDLWYSNNQPKFAWEVEEEGLGFAFNLDEYSLGLPAQAYYFSQDQIFSFTEVGDGFWYFHLKVQYENGWSPVAHYRIKVDTTPPEFFLPSIEDNGVIYFSALDKHSGIAYYEMNIDGSGWQMAQSPYILTDEDRQGKIMNLRTVDNAGNIKEIKIDLVNLEVIEEEKLVEEIKPEVVLPEEKILERIVEKVIVKTEAVLTDSLNSINNNVLENSTVEEIFNNVVTPAMLGVAVTNTLPELLAALMQSWPYLSLFFSEPLLWLFRSRRRKWGVVYNSLTKVPIGLAAVRLYQKGNKNVIQTKITDTEGRFMFMVKESGIYYLDVVKADYVFPTRYLGGEINDGKYLDIYHGEDIKITDNKRVISPNIPIDPVDKKLIPREVAIKIYLIKKFRLFVSYFGIISAIFGVIIISNVFTITALGIHFFLYYIFRKLIVPKRPKNWGMVFDKGNKKALHLAIVRIFDLKFNKLLETQVTDMSGRYGFLVGKNIYQLIAEKDEYRKEVIKPIDLINKERIIALDIGLKKLKGIFNNNNNNHNNSNANQIDETNNKKDNLP